MITPPGPSTMRKTVETASHHEKGADHVTASFRERHAFAVPLPSVDVAKMSDATRAAPTSLQVLPLPDADGMLLARDGRKVRIKDLAELVKASNEEAQAIGRMPIDLDHEIHDWWEPGGPASGWFTGYEVRADGVYATGIEWLDRGREAIETKAYGFTSVTMDAEFVVLEQDPVWGFVTDYELRPTALTGFALTNIPAMRNKAIFAAKDPTMKNTALLSMFVALGLQPGATPEAAAEAAASLAAENKRLREQLAEQAPKADTHVPRAEFDRLVAERDELKAQVAKAAADKRQAELDGVLAEFADRIPPSQRDFYRRSAEALGVDEFRKFASALPSFAGEVKMPKGQATSGLTDDERRIAAKMGLTEAEFTAAKKPRTAG